MGEGRAVAAARAGEMRPDPSGYIFGTPAKYEFGSIAQENLAISTTTRKWARIDGYYELTGPTQRNSNSWAASSRRRSQHQSGKGEASSTSGAELCRSSSLDSGMRFRGRLASEHREATENKSIPSPGTVVGTSRSGP
jgi:hypothetical protein